jgi:hypothetical protein
MENKHCPINFGDCSDCEFFIAKTCEHKFFDELNQQQLISFINLAHEMSFISNIERILLRELAKNVTEEDNDEDEEE